jgi:hypothetical protein
MARVSEQITYTTFDGRTITNVDALLRDPKVQETIRKLSRNRDPGPKQGSLTVLRYRKPD